jgi:hypothetical protein
MVQLLRDHIKTSKHRNVGATPDAIPSVDVSSSTAINVYWTPACRSKSRKHRDMFDDSRKNHVFTQSVFQMEDRDKVRCQKWRFENFNKDTYELLRLRGT